MTKIGYARTSTKEQHLDRQIRSLKENGCEKIFKDQLSGKNTNRPELKKMLNFIREDDIVMIHSLDRLGRNSQDNQRLIQIIQSKGATLDIMNMPVMHNNSNPKIQNLVNSIIMNVFNYVAEDERTKILERQRQGIKIAKEKGLYKGRQPKFTDDSKQVQRAIQLFKENNDYTMSDIAKFCNMSRSTLYRIIKKYNLK